MYNLLGKGTYGRRNSKILRSTCNKKVERTRVANEQDFYVPSGSEETTTTTTNLRNLTDGTHRVLYREITSNLECKVRKVGRNTVRHGSYRCVHLNLVPPVNLNETGSAKSRGISNLFR